MEDDNSSTIDSLWPWKSMVIYSSTIIGNNEDFVTLLPYWFITLYGIFVVIFFLILYSIIFPANIKRVSSFTWCKLTFSLTDVIRFTRNNSFRGPGLQ